jgi:16S rRNA (adenine1518-N6/adenine1519-N6)-dimethyltransferase
MPAKPKLGQNYLHDAQAIQRIVASLGDISGRTVVEIGPGRGAITGVLANRAGHVLAIELDPDLASRLRSEFPPERVTVVDQDMLNFDFAAAAAKAGQRLPVVGNLPYYITSPILLKLAASHAALDRAILMVQREVADRVASGPVEKLFTLPPSAFSPPPEVHSTVFRWRFAPRFVELGIEEAGFLPFVRQAFAQKRKTLANNLRAAGIDPATVAKMLSSAAVDPLARAEALPIEVLSVLWRSLQKERATPSGEVATPVPNSPL